MAVVSSVKTTGLPAPAKRKSKEKGNGWISVGNTPGNSKKRKGRRQRRNQANSSNVNNSANAQAHRPTKTLPKHAAPASASTIYCEWYQKVEYPLSPLVNSVCDCARISLFPYMICFTCTSTSEYHRDFVIAGRIAFSFTYVSRIVSHDKYQ